MPIIAEVPVARPSIPSVMFAPFDTAVTITITKRISFGFILGGKRIVKTYYRRRKIKSS
jgi:hypothetical protein